MTAEMRTDCSVQVEGFDPVTVNVEMTGYVEPSLGRFVWYGRIRGLNEALGTEINSDTSADIIYDGLLGNCVIHGTDLFGGHTFDGVGTPPFAQLPTDEPVN